MSKESGRFFNYKKFSKGKLIKSTGDENCSKQAVLILSAIIDWLVSNLGSKMHRPMQITTWSYSFMRSTAMTNGMDGHL